MHVTLNSEEVMGSSRLCSASTWQRRRGAHDRSAELRTVAHPLSALSPTECPKTRRVARPASLEHGLQLTAQDRMGLQLNTSSDERGAAQQAHSHQRRPPASRQQQQHGMTVDLAPRREPDLPAVGRTRGKIHRELRTLADFAFWSKWPLGAAGAYAGV